MLLRIETVGGRVSLFTAPLSHVQNFIPVRGYLMWWKRHRAQIRPELRKECCHGDAWRSAERLVVFFPLKAVDQRKTLLMASQLFSLVLPSPSSLIHQSLMPLLSLKNTVSTALRAHPACPPPSLMRPHAPDQGQLCVDLVEQFHPRTRDGSLEPGQGPHRGRAGPTPATTGGNRKSKS